MTSVFAARRAAEEFAGLVDGTRTDVADRYAALGDVVTLLTEQPRVEARPAFVSDLRDRLMAAADFQLTIATPTLRSVPSTTTSSTRTPLRPHRLGTAAAAALVVVGGTTGVAAASQGALPGDGLYNVKRGIENVTSVFSTSDADKGGRLLDRAGTRLHEVEALTAAGADSERITSTLEDFSASASHGAGLLFRSYQSGGRSSDIAKVRDFASEQRAALAALADLAPVDARDAFAAVDTQLDAIDTEALSLCAGCGGAVDSAFRDATSAAALDALLAVPAAIKAKPKAQPHKSKPAPSHSSSSGTTGQDLPPAPTATAAPTPTATSTPDVTQQVTDTVKDTIGGVVAPVTGLVDQVGESTGLSAVTDPVTGLLNGLTGK